MLKDPPVKTGGPDLRHEPPVGVSGMQAKLHRWAVADPGRRFDDLFNFVHDPATLRMAFAWVASNTGRDTPGVDGWTVAAVDETVGVAGFLDDLRALQRVEDGSYDPSIRSGAPIPDERLEADPAAELTVQQAARDQAADR